MKIKWILNWNNLKYAYIVPGIATFGTILFSNFATINKSEQKHIFYAEPGFMSMMVVLKAICYGSVWPYCWYEICKKPSNILKMNFYDLQIDEEMKIKEEGRNEDNKKE